MRDQEWDSTTTKLNTLDLAELVLSLLGLNSVDGETALGVVDETEVLASLLDGDDIHEASGVGRVSPDLAIDLDQALHDNRRDLLARKSILEAVAEENGEGKGFTELVGTGGGAGSLLTEQLQ